ncbi:hypothetical protein LRAMOSA05823 [Lichtheimia ramosa]|uniref:Velvet domain-containing protein n=1 Tax=Lichtheimia ramosa TaxID=688394 RepID=A0A077X3S6_9FUNG|nr:hypothetical protein LRAMOSA05823 [Lichtheimia ramosa]
MSEEPTSYRLVVVQNPLRARCCGFGEKDRRLLDPPPILQLFTIQPDNSLQPVTDIDVDCTFVVHCDLYDESGKENRSVVYVPSSIPPSEQHAPQGPAGSLVLSLKSPRPIRNLLGTITANASRLFNDRNEPGVYFIFHDLSIRTDGRFSLKFLMLGLPCNTSNFPPFSTSIQNEVFSEPFTVYTAKKFPGMTESTPLSRAFANQGIKIITRREASYTRASDKYYKMPSSAIPSSSTTSNDNNATTTTHSHLSIASITLPSNIEPCLPSNSTTTTNNNQSNSNNPASSYTRIPITQYLSAPPTKDNNAQLP